MAMTSADLDFLTSDRGIALLETLVQENLSEQNTLRLLTALRKSYTPDESSAALTMARLRFRARDKFGDDAGRLLFTADALEQASHPAVRAYRSATVRAETILDVCCGIGSDSLAFAQQGRQVLGLDLDPVRIAIARHNADVLGINVDFQVGDVREGLPDGYRLAFFDPARRTETGQRIFDVEQYQPPLSLIQNWFAPQIMVKLSPGVQLDQIEAYGGGVEFISVDGDLKEAVLYRGYDIQGLRATLLTDGEVYHWQRKDEPDVPIGEPLLWLVEPDPALIRAGLVQDTAAEWGGRMLDETIAYFTTSQQPDSVWARQWEILDWMPFNLKKLRAYLKEHTIGQVTVKKRGFPMLPEEITAKLKLKKGSKSRTLVFTRYAGNPVVIICRDIHAN